MPLRLIGIVLAAACGLTVANLYYAQPLLALISTSLHVSEGAATLVVTLTQVGYAVGLIFLLPAGDLVENRTLVTRTLFGTAVALLLAGVSPDFGAFLAVSVLVGLTSVVAQILVPFAAHLAPPEQRGRFVGQVMSGLLLGILLARTVASLIAQVWGWRAIYVISAVLMLVLAIVLRKVLPTRPPSHTAGYGALLASVVTLARDEPVLRRLALSQACMFGSFTAFWTAIAYELISAHGLSQGEIGLFALVGAAGAAAAPVAGRLADRGWGRSARLGALLLGSVAMILAAVGSGSLVLLAVSGVLLDFAVQGHQVMSQQVIYALREDARARINTVYMGSVFIGGAISSAVAGLLHDTSGWTGVALYSAALPLIGAVLWFSGATTVAASEQA